MEKNTNLQTCTGSAAFTIGFLVHDSAQDVDANGLRCSGEGRESTCWVQFDQLQHWLWYMQHNCGLQPFGPAA